MKSLSLIVMGLSITSSWGNGHATTYRALIKALHQLGHRVLFLERDVPWYARHRDQRQPAGCRVELYGDLQELERKFARDVEAADVVMVGSYVPDGAEALRWVLDRARGVKLFYDIDTPVTLARLESGEPTYLTRDLIPELDAYLSFSGGAALKRLTEDYGARAALPLFCSVDPELYAPLGGRKTHALGYLGTYCADRHAALERLLLEPARKLAERRFVVAGACYPEQAWPSNVERVEHVPPGEHSTFYDSLRFTLNVTRAHMIDAGHAPSVRLFEAAACGVPTIGDSWPGIEDFFEPGKEILLANTAGEVVDYLVNLRESERRSVARRARRRVLGEHTALHRARQLEAYWSRLGAASSSPVAAAEDPDSSSASQKMVGS